MADSKISAMPAAATLDGTELTPIVQTGVNKQVTTANYVAQVLNVNPVLVSQGGTGSTTAAGARTNLSAAYNAITLTAGTGLSGGGDLTANRTFAIANTGVTAATYGSATQIPVITFNAQGQATSASNVTLTAASINASHGMFVSTANQPNGGSTTANLVALDTQIITAVGISNAAGAITIANAGIYEVIFELFYTSTAGANPVISQWLSQNGTNIANSTQDFQLLGGANTVQASSCVWHVQASASDTIRAYWSCSDTRVSLAYQSALTNPTRPASPSAIFTIKQIG
jgi:hypothetical protein